MEKKIKKLVLPCCIAFCIVYVFVAVYPLSKEIQFEPVWTVDATRVTKFDEDTDMDKLYENAIPFKMGQTAGYFTNDGQILNLVPFPYKATVAPANYAIFGMNAKNTPLYNPKGEKIGEIANSGFPFFDGNRRFLFLPGGSSFASLGETGEINWDYEYFAPITAFSSSLDGTVAGFADGVIVSFTPDGQVDQRFTPGGSEFPVILGVGISDSGNYIASVSGQNEQRFIIAKKIDGHTSVIFHKFLETPVNGQVLVKFSKNENFVYFGCKEKLGVVDCKSLRSAEIPVSGSIISIKESDSDGTVFVLSKKDGTYSVSVIEPFAVFAGTFSFNAESAFIGVKGNSLFVGRDSKISRIDIHHR